MPTWLQKYRPNLIDLMVVVSLALVGVRPIVRASLPCSDDAAFHLLRLVQLDWLLTNGIWFSRWAPNMANGYGFPLFNYYAPLSYYAAEVVSGVTRDLYTGLQWTFALGFILAGWTMFLLARLYVGRPAAYTAAAAYLYAPYHGYDIHFRGNLAESFAWWLLPLALWAMIRLVRSGSWRWVGWGALAYAAVLLTHNAFALIFSPLLAGWALWAWWFSQGDGPKRRATTTFWQINVALGLGLLLAAFFWFPALTERHLIHTERLLVPPVFVYWGNFVTLGELFAWPRPVYTDLINPSIPRAIGAVTGLLALPALGWLGVRGRGKVLGQETFAQQEETFAQQEDTGAQRQVTLFCLLSFAFCLFLMLPLSRPIWDSVPLLEFIQFPWRLLGVAALIVALLVGLGVEWLGRFSWGRWAFAAAIPLLVLGSLFWFSPRHCPGLENATIADIILFEQATQTIGTTAKGEYQPQTSDAVPAAPFTTPFSLPEGAELVMNSWTPLNLYAAIDAAKPSFVTANQFAFPGWRARVNGQEVNITPSAPEGLITFEVPAGRSEIEVAFRETPRRLAADLLSLAALLAAAGLIGFGGAEPRQTAEIEQSHARLSSPVSALLGIILLGVVILLPQFGTRLKRSWLEQRAGQTPAAVFEGGVVVHDYRLERRGMPADGSLRVDLWLAAAQPLSRDIQSRVQLVDSSGAIWSPAETIWPRIYRPYFGSSAWQTDEYAQEILLAAGIPGTPPGTYTMELVIFDKASRQPLANQNGQLATPLGTVELTRPDEAWTPAGQTSYSAADGRFDALQLLASSVDRTAAGVGDPFTVTAFWGVNQPSDLDYAVDLALIDADGRPLWQRTVEPVRDVWPTSLWQPGDVWRGRTVDRFPADLPSGDYIWTLCARPVDQKCGRNPLPLGTVALTAPERLFSPPAIDQLLEQSFDELAILSGFEGDGCQPGDGRCDLTLVWQATGQTKTSYRVFVQLLGPDGRVVAQSDREPANWSRPTTSWVAGEFIVDPHALSWDPAGLPAGEYRLITGLYDPATGRRLTTAEGDAVTLQTGELE